MSLESANLNHKTNYFIALFKFVRVIGKIYAKK